MSTKDSRSKESTDTEETTVGAATGAFEVRSDPTDPTELKIGQVRSDGGGLVTVGLRSEHLNGRIFLTADEAEAVAAAVQEAAGQVREYTE